MVNERGAALTKLCGEPLDVLVIGLLGIAVFETILSILRTYLFAHTTNRIDVELGARLFRHLLALPMAYFQARRVGDSVARVRELENILERAVALLQGDVIQAMVMAGDTVPLSLKRRNFDYYEPLTTHDSTLSATAFAILAAEIGEDEKLDGPRNRRQPDAPGGVRIADHQLIAGLQRAFRGVLAQVDFVQAGLLRPGHVVDAGGRRGGGHRLRRGVAVERRVLPHRPDRLGHCYVASRSPWRSSGCSPASWRS